MNMTENKLITLFTYKGVDFLGIDSGDSNLQVCLLPIFKFLKLEPFNAFRALENVPLGEDVGSIYAVSDHSENKFWECVSLSNTPKILVDLDFKSLSYTNTEFDESVVNVQAGILHWCFSQLMNTKNFSFLEYETFNPFQLQLFQETLN